jgi:hypothetical protein
MHSKYDTQIKANTYLGEPWAHVSGPEVSLPQRGLSAYAYYLMKIFLSARCVSLVLAGCLFLQGMGAGWMHPRGCRMPAASFDVQAFANTPMSWRGTKSFGSKPVARVPRAESLTVAAGSVGTPWVMGAVVFLTAAKVFPLPQGIHILLSIYVIQVIFHEVLGHGIGARKAGASWMEILHQAPLLRSPKIYPTQRHEYLIAPTISFGIGAGMALLGWISHSATVGMTGLALTITVVLDLWLPGSDGQRALRHGQGLSTQGHFLQYEFEYDPNTREYRAISDSTGEKLKTPFVVRDIPGDDERRQRVVELVQRLTGSPWVETTRTQRNLVIEIKRQSGSLTSVELPLAAVAVASRPLHEVLLAQKNKWEICLVLLSAYVRSFRALEAIGLRPSSDLSAWGVVVEDWTKVDPRVVYRRVETLVDADEISAINPLSIEPYVSERIAAWFKNLIYPTDVIGEEYNSAPEVPAPVAAAA